MSKKVLNFRRLFSNTKFILAVSIVSAFVFWIVVAVEYAPVVENVIEGVPVQIDVENSVPSRLGLQTFTNGEYTVDITVKGNRYDIGGDLLSSDDFIVVAQTSYVDSSGNHSLAIKANVKDPNADYEIIGLSSEYIEVYFDRFEEKELELKPRIITELESLTEDGFMFDEQDIIMSEKTVKISGAKTEVDKIISAYADISVTEHLEENLTVDAPIRLSNGTSDTIKHVLINGNVSVSVPVTLPVYKIQTLPVSVSFINSPSGYLDNTLEYKCSPSTVKVAVMQNGSKNEDTLDVGIIDFHKISPNSNSFVFESSDIADVKILDGTKKFTVKVDTASIKSTKIKADPTNVVITGSTDNVSFDVVLEQSGEVIVCGEPASLSGVNSKNITGNIDLSNVIVDKTGTRVPVVYSVRSNGTGWVTGTYYALVKIK